MKWVYAFGDGQAEGDAAMHGLLGAKGANLAEMSRLGLAVPPGFTLTTEVCTYYYANDRNFPPDLKSQVTDALARIGALAGAGFGDADNPLLVSVRSGAGVSMPGMMDTVLNLGLTAAATEGLARRTGDARFVHDTARRFIQMYASVVLGVDHAQFEDILDRRKDEKGVTLDTQLDAADLKAIAEEFRTQAADFPENAGNQLWGAIRAVLESWQSPRAIAYRQMHGIAHDLGTAVTVQAMVFGNRGAGSATGVAFTRDPSTGEKTLYGEFLTNAQGEDVVAGLRTPDPVTEAARLRQGGRRPSMQAAMPDAYAQLLAIGNRLEAHYRDMQDMEFTVQEGRLFILQTRTAKRTAQAALSVAVAMANEGLIDRKTAVVRVDPAALRQLSQPVLDPAAAGREIGLGLGASPGAAAGEAVFTAGEAAERAAAGADVILIRTETSAEDIRGMDAARGILTARGGMTSHAAIVARGMGRPCICGASHLKIDAEKGEMLSGTVMVRRGDILTIDGGSGKIYLGKIAMRAPDRSGDFGILMAWADEYSTS